MKWHSMNVGRCSRTLLAACAGLAAAFAGPSWAQGVDDIGAPKQTPNYVTDDMLLSLRVTVPIFNSQGQGLQFLAAKERETQAQLNWDVRRRELAQKTQTTFLEVVSNSERVKILASATAAQERVAAGQRTKFQTGLTTITNVLDAEAASYRAKREYLAIVKEVDGKFWCVGEYPSINSAKGMEFEVTSNGIRLKRGPSTPPGGGGGAVGGQPLVHGRRLR